MWIPEITIFAPEQTVFPMKIFTEMGGLDWRSGVHLVPNKRESYPYLFIQTLDRHTTGRERRGLTERYHYDYFMNVRFYIDINPFERERIPRLNEELASMELKLERVLQYLEMWGGTVHTENRRSTVQEGVLHFFMNVKVHEDVLLPEEPKVESLDIGINLKNLGGPFDTTNG